MEIGIVAIFVISVIFVDFCSFEEISIVCAFKTTYFSISTIDSICYWSVYIFYNFWTFDRVYWYLCEDWRLLILVWQKYNININAKVDL